MRRAARTDANQGAVVQALLQAGCTVTLLHHVGDGCPDALVWDGKRFVLMEIKDGEKSPSRRKLTPDQEMWHAAHAGAPVYIVESVEQALSVLVVDKPCEHVWKVTHEGLTWHDCRCDKCGETKRESWD